MLISPYKSDKSCGQTATAPEKNKSDIFPIRIGEPLCPFA